MSRIVIVRPQPGAGFTLNRARDLGLDAVAIPLFGVEPRGWQAPDLGRFDALLLTSTNALRYGGASLTRLRSLPVHAVGQATAAAARDSGFDVATVGQVGVASLLAIIPPGCRLLHLCGEDRMPVANTRHLITAVSVYRSVAIADPNLALLPGDTVLVHSPRAGQRLAELARRRDFIRIVAISEAAAAAVGAGWARVDVPVQPDDAAMLALAS